MASRIRPLFLIVTAFWAYVAASNVIYAHSMQQSLTALHHEDFFACWEARLLQHLFLYPLLLGAVWASLRIGWQPIARRLPLQVLMGAAFAAAASPALWLGEWLMSDAGRYEETWASAAGVMAHMMPGSRLPIWLASATTFLLTYGFAVALVRSVPRRSSGRSPARIWRRCACSCRRIRSSICCIPSADRSSGIRRRRAP